MISEKDINDWVHVGDNLITELKQAKPEEGSLFNNTKLCHQSAETLELIRDRLSKMFTAKSYEEQVKVKDDLLGLFKF
jgi:hypothetical protein